MEKAFINAFIRLLIILFFLVCSSLTHIFAIGNNHTDYESLLAFKNQFLKQGMGASSAIFMNSWNHTNHFCSWEGVACGRKHPNRVTALNLSSGGLVGPLPPSITNLTFLKRLDLSLNQLYGEIPPSLAHLRRLQHLNLSFNSFYGDIPTTLMTNNSLIQVIDLCCNNLTGKIPPFISSMPQLNNLLLYKNHITGTIPQSIGNLSFLKVLYVFSNNLEGGIPPEIGGLRKLKQINVAENNLSGNIPPSFYNISSLRIISIADNKLSGDIAIDIAQAFPDLKIFYIGINHFIGLLDQAFQNVTSLEQLDISRNNFTGVVPPNLGKMHKLTKLDMESNELIARDAQDWRFLDSLTNCTSLTILGLYGNKLGGILPKSILNLSIELQIITLGNNYISGIIPFEFDKYVNLINLGWSEIFWKVLYLLVLGNLEGYKFYP